MEALFVNLDVFAGWDYSREVYQQMLANAKADEFNALVVTPGSRLGRDKLERLDKFTDLANHFQWR